MTETRTSITSTVTSSLTDPTPAELLIQTAEALPDLVTTPSQLRHSIASLTQGEGPVAVDAERAHGFRYSQRAYLIQLRRRGSGTHLIDPVEFGEPADLSSLGTSIADAEWIIHAASQDLACLYEVGLTPLRLFDTELAARLLGYPRVALGTMIEELLSVRLLKEHSASDWSKRPLPDEWLTYAALDVELLIELRDRLAAELVETGKVGWAQEEFAALVAGIGLPVEARRDPWRRTSGIHKVRTRRGLAYVAELWHARDRIAAQLDRAPGRILPDAGISDLAALATEGRGPDRSTLRRIPGFSRRQARQFEADWVAALGRAAARSEADLPVLHLPTEGPPQPRLWAAKDPIAAARLARIKVALAEISTAVNVPVENLLTPDYVRRVAWRPPDPISAESVDTALAALGARPWQRELTVPDLTAALIGSSAG
ncbi:MAG TPA: HRDC domain-containing protein [Microlunatus sp.]